MTTTSYGDCPYCGRDTITWNNSEIQPHTCPDGRVIDTQEKFWDAWREYWTERKMI